MKQKKDKGIVLDDSPLHYDFRKDPEFQKKDKLTKAELKYKEELEKKYEKKE